MEQTFINWLYGIATLLITAVVKWLWAAHKDLQATFQEIPQEVWITT